MRTLTEVDPIRHLAYLTRADKPGSELFKKEVDSNVYIALDILNLAHRIYVLNWVQISRVPTLILIRE